MKALFAIVPTVLVLSGCLSQSVQPGSGSLTLQEQENAILNGKYFGLLSRIPDICPTNEESRMSLAYEMVVVGGLYSASHPYINYYESARDAILQTPAGNLKSDLRSRFGTLDKFCQDIIQEVTVNQKTRMGS